MNDFDLMFVLSLVILVLLMGIAFMAGFNAGAERISRIGRGE